MKTPTILLFTSLLAFAACTSEPAQAHESKPSQSSNKPAAGAPQAGENASSNATEAGGIYTMEATTLEGEAVSMADYKGKVTLIVNVASACGYTPQYAGLQKLHSELADKGFAVLGFPSNEFGGQEPGSAEEIRKFCSSKYSVDFPMFAKVETLSGDGQSPIYAALQKATGEQPKWNFCKYLVGKDGAPISFYPSGVRPDAKKLRQAIEAALE